MEQPAKPNVRKILDTTRRPGVSGAVRRLSHPLIVRSNPDDVLILDIDHRKKAYRVPKTKTDPADKMRMKESDFDDVMAKALGAEPHRLDAKNDDNPKRLSSYPHKKR